MWRVYKSLGLYSQADYDDSAWEKPDAVPPLDEIRVAARARIGVIDLMGRTMGLLFCVTAVAWLGYINDIFLDGTEPNNMHNFPTSHPKFAGHFSALCTAGVLEDLTGDDPQRRRRRGEISYISSYFSVPKNEESSRSIFNGRNFSRFCKRPPPVNIPEVQATNRRLIHLAGLASKKHQLQGFTADIRHWFHQIPVDPDVTRFFGLAMVGEGLTKIFEWKTLPMGWSYSPRICQCLAWTLILHHDEPESNLDGLALARRQLRDAEHPPQYVNLLDDHNNLVGFISLTYDNIGVFTINHNLATTLEAKVRTNFEQMANIELKEVITTTGDAMSLGSPLSPRKEFKGIRYLGVQYGVVYGGRRKPLLYWRHDPDKMDRWKDKLLDTDPESETIYTARDICQRIGMILWNMTVSMTPLCRCNDILVILRDVALHVGGVKAKWDEPLGVPEDIAAVINVRMSTALVNAWCSGASPTVSPQDPTIIFTDAAGEACMGCVVVRSGAVLDWQGHEYNPGLQQCHIFLKELSAACWYVQRAISKFQLQGQRIVVAVDNSATAFALRHMYSSNMTANQWLSHLQDGLDAAECSLEVIQVTSEDNPADDPSRRASDLDEDRLKRGLRAVEEALQGRRSGSEPQEAPTDLVRHPIDGVTILHALDGSDVLLGSKAD